MQIIVLYVPRFCNPKNKVSVIFGEETGYLLYAICFWAIFRWENFI